VLQLDSDDKDGATHIVMSPLEFVLPAATAT
jgi:hypothetical protein